MAATGSVSLRSFYVRRARRLLPALVVALAGYLVLSVAIDAIRPGFTNLTDDVRSAGAGLFFATNVTWVWWKLPAAGRHLWILSIEEQFYLVWPVVLVVVLRIWTSRRWLVAVPVSAPSSSRRTRSTSAARAPCGSTPGPTPAPPRCSSVRVRLHR